MRCALWIKIGAALALAWLLLPAACAQINPATQIRWPANCNTPGYAYNFSLNSCILAATTGLSGLPTTGGTMTGITYYSGSGVASGTLANLGGLPANGCTSTAGGNIACPGSVAAGATNSAGIPQYPYQVLNTQASPKGVAWTSEINFGTSIDAGADAPTGQDFVSLLVAPGGLTSGGLTKNNQAVNGSLWCDINADVFDYDNPVAGDGVFRMLDGGPNDATHNTLAYAQTAGECENGAVAWEAIPSSNKCNTSSFGSTCMGQSYSALPASWQSDRVAVSQVVSTGSTCTVTTSSNLIASGETQILSGFTGGNTALNGVYGLVSSTGLSTISYQMPCTVAAGTYTGAGITSNYLNGNFVETNTNVNSGAVLPFVFNFPAVNSANLTNQVAYIFVEMFDGNGGIIHVHDVNSTNTFTIPGYTASSIATGNSGAGFPGEGKNSVKAYAIPYDPNHPTAARPSGTDTFQVSCISPTGVQNKCGVFMALGPAPGAGDPVWLLGPTFQLYQANDEQISTYRDLSETIGYLAQNNGLNVLYHPTDGFFFGTANGGSTPEMNAGITNQTGCNPLLDTTGYKKHPCVGGHAEMEQAVLAPSTRPKYHLSPYFNLDITLFNPFPEIFAPKNIQQLLAAQPAQATSTINLSCDGRINGGSQPGFVIPINYSGNTLINLPQCAGPLWFIIPGNQGSGKVSFFPTPTGADGYFALHKYQWGILTNTNNVLSNGYAQWYVLSNNQSATQETESNATVLQEDAATSFGGVNAYMPNLTSGGFAGFYAQNQTGCVSGHCGGFLYNPTGDFTEMWEQTGTNVPFEHFPDGHTVTQGYAQVGGKVNAYDNITVNALATPVNKTFTTALTGGTCLDTTSYYYRVAALNSNGTTLASTETSITTGNSGANTNTVTVNWGYVAGATSYKVYGRTTGGELLLATIANGYTLAWTDDCTGAPSGALPVANTTLGNFYVGTNPIPVAQRYPSFIGGLTGSSGTTVYSANFYTFDYPITVTGGTYSYSVAQANCTIAPTVVLYDVTAASTVGTILTVANSQSSQFANGVTLNVPAGDTFKAGITSASSACSTYPSGQFTLEYKMTGSQ